MDKPMVVLKVVFIDTSKYPNKLKQARIIVDTALEMLKAGQYPVDQIKIEVKE